MGSEELGLKDASIATREDAEKAMSSIDEALKRVSNERSRLGAYQNRLEHAYNANVNTAENLSDRVSYSRCRYRKRDDEYGEGANFNASRSICFSLAYATGPVHFKIISRKK